MRRFSISPMRFLLLFVFLPGCPNVFNGCGSADTPSADIVATPLSHEFSCEPLDAAFDPPPNSGRFELRVETTIRASDISNEEMRIFEVASRFSTAPVPEAERKVLFLGPGLVGDLVPQITLRGSNVYAHTLDTYLLRCVDIAYIRVELRYRRLDSANFGEGEDLRTDFRVLTLRRVSVEPDPDPDPDPTGGAIESGLSIVGGISAMDGVDGKKKLLVTGAGGSEIWDLGTLTRDLSMPTIDGAGGAAAYTPEGQFVYTVLLDRDTGAVRFETFDPTTGQPVTSPDFNASQFLLGPTALPLLPVLFNRGIFSAPGALGQYTVRGTFPGPKLDGDETIQPFILIDVVGAGQRRHRAIVVDPKGQDVLIASWNDGDTSTFVSRRESAPTDNPANFFGDTLTIPGTIDRLLAAGDCLLAWEAGSDVAKAYTRAAGGDLTELQADVAIPADSVDAARAPDGANRGYFLRPESIREISDLGSGAETTRDIALPAGRVPLELVVCDVGATRKAIVRFEDGIEVVSLE